MKELWGDLFIILDRRSRVRAVALFLMMVVAAGLEGLGIGAILPFLLLVTTAGDTQSIPSEIAGVFEGRDPGSSILLAAALLFALYVVKNAFLFLTDFTQFRFLFSRHIEVATRLYHAYMHRSFEDHMQKPTAELLRNIDHDVRLVFTNVFVPALTLTIEVLTAIAIGITLLYLEPDKTPWIIGVLFLVGYVFYRVTNKAVSRLGRAQQFHQGEMIKWVSHGIHAFKEISVGRKQEHFVENFRNAGRQFAAAMCFHRTVQAVPVRLIELLGVGAILAVVAATILQGGKPEEILPAVGLLTAAGVRLMPSMNRILTAVTAIRHFSPSLQVVADEFRSMGDLTERDTKDTSILQPGSWEAVRFDHVSFRYPGARENAVQDICFRVNRGESVALVGRSGSGKTTVADLLLGLLRPTGGRIEFEGAYNSVTLSSSLPPFGYVPQPSYVLEDSVRRNVAFGRPDSKIDDAQVWRSLESVHLSDVVEKMDEKIDSHVGRDGVRMSGGQRQRLGIARALYDDPDVLVLDEATSALDNETEREVSDAIMALAGKKTLFIIAHRLNTIQQCDRVLFLESGRIVGRGNYQTLSEKNELFRRLITAGDF